MSSSSATVGPIKNVVFDIGNVLVRWDSLGIVEAAFGLSGEEAKARRHALFGETDIWRALNRGEHTEGGAKAAYVEAGLLTEGEAEAMFAALYDSLHLLDTNGLVPEETVFFDDMPGNVAGAQAAGMHAFVFTDAAQAERDLVSLGVTL